MEEMAMVSRLLRFLLPISQLLVESRNLHFFAAKRSKFNKFH